MARILDLKKGKETPHSASLFTMDTLRKYVDRDVILTAIVVIPASTIWITTNQTWLALLVGGVLYLCADYGYPMLRGQKIDVQPLVRLYNHVRGIVQSRIARRA